jgi:hypothetical protein
VQIPNVLNAAGQATDAVDLAQEIFGKNKKKSIDSFHFANSQSEFENSMANQKAYKTYMAKQKAYQNYMAKQESKQAKKESKQANTGMSQRFRGYPSLFSRVSTNERKKNNR